MPQTHKEKRQITANLKLLELQAINKPKGKLRQVLNKGLYKFKPEDFEKLRDIRQERRVIKQVERENRLENFCKEMDTIGQI